MGALGHDFRQAGSGCSHVFAARRQGHQPSATAQGTFCTQQRGPGETPVATNQQQVTELAFMGILRPCTQARQLASAQQLNVR